MALFLLWEESLLFCSPPHTRKLRSEESRKHFVVQTTITGYCLRNWLVPTSAGFRESVFQVETPAGISFICFLGQVCSKHLLCSQNTIQEVSCRALQTASDIIRNTSESIVKWLKALKHLNHLSHWTRWKWCQFPCSRLPSEIEAQPGNDPEFLALPGHVVAVTLSAFPGHAAWNRTIGGQRYYRPYSGGQGRSAVSLGQNKIYAPK